MGCFFFFQAEDGIRDHCVTGVQTCALPIPHVNTAPTCVCETISVKIEDKKFLVKNSDFPLARTWQKLQSLKSFIMGFLGNRQPEECETSPHRLRPQYEYVRLHVFQTKSKTKIF